MLVIIFSSRLRRGQLYYRNLASFLIALPSSGDLMVLRYCLNFSCSSIGYFKPNFTRLYFTAKSARERCKCPWKHVKICPWTSKSARKKLRFFCPWTPKSARENDLKSARERTLLPVNFHQKVPMNAKKCPWNMLKKSGSRALLRVTGKKKNTAAGGRALNVWRSE